MTSVGFLIIGITLWNEDIVIIKYLFDIYNIVCLISSREGESHRVCTVLNLRFKAKRVGQALPPTHNFFFIHITVVITL